MYTITVNLSIGNRPEVARYRFDDKAKASAAKIGIMTEWVRVRKMKVLVSSVISPR